MTEADTCRKFVVPLLQAAGWDNDPHSIAEQRYFTAGRIVSQGPTARRRPGKGADYLLRYTRDLPLAVVEAKAGYKHPADGLQQAKDYATTPRYAALVRQFLRCAPVDFQGRIRPDYHLRCRALWGVAAAI